MYVCVRERERYIYIYRDRQTDRERERVAPRSLPLDTFIYDAKLSFGVAKSCGIFQRLSSAVCRIMWCRYGVRVIAYLDDFLIIEKCTSCLAALNNLLLILRRLGFSINWNKVEGPMQRLVFLGILIDTHLLTLSLPKDKQDEFSGLVKEYINKKRVSRKQLERLIGKLNWACQVVRGGRNFLRRMLTLQNSVKLGNHKIIVTNAFLADLRWWDSFMDTFNGCVSFLDKSPVTNLQTDACLHGGGGYYNGDYFYINWELDMPDVIDKHINLKEAISILLALERWAPMLQNKHVIIYTDNVTAKSVINKGTSPSDWLMAYLIRASFWTQAKYNFSVKAVYLPGRCNLRADSISRLHEPFALSRLYDYLHCF